MTEDNWIIAVLMVIVVLLFLACIWLIDRYASASATLKRQANNEVYLKHLHQALKEVLLALDSTGENRAQAHKVAKDHLAKMEHYARALYIQEVGATGSYQYIPEVIKRLTDYCITIKDPAPE